MFFNSIPTQAMFYNTNATNNALCILVQKTHFLTAGDTAQVLGIQCLSAAALDFGKLFAQVCSQPHLQATVNHSSSLEVTNGKSCS